MRTLADEVVVPLHLELKRRNAGDAIEHRAVFINEARPLKLCQRPATQVEHHVAAKRNMLAQLERHSSIREVAEPHVGLLAAIGIDGQGCGRCIDIRRSSPGIEQDAVDLLSTGIEHLVHATLDALRGDVGSGMQCRWSDCRGVVHEDERLKQLVGTHPIRTVNREVDRRAKIAKDTLLLIGKRSVGAKVVAGNVRQLRAVQSDSTASLACNQGRDVCAKSRRKVTGSAISNITKLDGCCLLVPGNAIAV